MLGNRILSSLSICIVYLWTSRKPRGYIEWTSNEVPGRVSCIQGCAPKPHRIPAKRDLNGLEIFHRRLATSPSLPLARQWRDLIRLFAKNEMISLYERETFDLRHGSRRRTWKHIMSSFLQINSWMRFFSTYTYIVCAQIHIKRYWFCGCFVKHFKYHIFNIIE